MTLIFRPGSRLIIPGAQVFSLRPAAAASGGWWDNNGAISGCICAYQPKGAASLSASYANLTGNATYNAAPGVAPTWDATGGWTFNGTTQYLTTGVVATATTTTIVRYSNLSSSGAVYLIGAFSTGNTRHFTAPNGAGGATIRRFSYAAIVQNAVGAYATSGVVALVGKTTSADFYSEGAFDSSISSTWSGTSAAFFVAALNNNGSTSGLASVKIQALAIYNRALSAGENSTLYTLIAAL